MNEEIRVHVVKYTSNVNFMMRFKDPLTGKQIARTTGTTKKREAERIAAKWEAELQEGRYRKRSSMTWEEFREYHDKHILSGMGVGSAGAYESSLNVFTRLAKPQKLSNITTARVTAFATKLREQGRSSATVARHLRHLKVVLRWAQRQGYLAELPTIDMPRQQNAMRGRPITLEEFERMLVVVPKVMGELAADSYRFYLRCLWESGLRLAESLKVRWDYAPGAIVVDLDGRRPMLRIPAQAEKGRTNRILPIVPEFAELLDSVPCEERRGRIFKLLTKTGELAKCTRHAIGPHVASIGEAAGIITNQRERKGDIVKEFASAHDLRRSFGFRWSRRVMPAVLKELMRHKTIETTMKYYVGVNAEATADELWKAVETSAHDSGNEKENAWKLHRL